MSFVIFSTLAAMQHFFSLSTSPASASSVFVWKFNVTNDGLTVLETLTWSSNAVDVQGRSKSCVRDISMRGIPISPGRLLLYRMLFSGMQYPLLMIAQLSLLLR